jgi:hypothetical protein
MPPRRRGVPMRMARLATEPREAGDEPWAGRGAGVKRVSSIFCVQRRPRVIGSSRRILFVPASNGQAHASTSPSISPRRSSPENDDVGLPALLPVITG